jgi:hypothetical protein
MPGGSSILFVSMQHLMLLHYRSIMLRQMLLFFSSSCVHIHLQREIGRTAVPWAGHRSGGGYVAAKNGGAEGCVVRRIRAKIYGARVQVPQE